MTLSGGYAVMPEQSTVAIIAHHPQAVYFGMKSGFIPEGKTSDELIAGTERGGDLPPESDPDEGADEGDGPGQSRVRRRGRQLAAGRQALRAGGAGRRRLDGSDAGRSPPCVQGSRPGIGGVRPPRRPV